MDKKSIPIADIDEKHSITRITGMYQSWFLDYASYVILERAVPAIEDGLKPVQRRILHAMRDLEDGRYNKVANVVGHTMQYHPHGDASIGDAMIQMGQKDLLIDPQGNWGNTFTGDSAAAARYIEARLSKFALDVVFNSKVTHWQLSYDGRKKEPINLPIKFPLLLAQGAEGIAVGLSTKILPHNFNELIDASIKHLKGKNFELYPDFHTRGIMDSRFYNDGQRGGRIRVRAKISTSDKSLLVISEIPFTTNTTSLIDSILKANDRGKIKIKKVEDNTSSEVEILVHLPSGISPDKTIDALYAFTACETSISPLGCVIEDNKPIFIGVSEMLKRSVNHTVSLLKKELDIQLQELQEQWHFTSLEHIFIAHKIYRDIETEESWKGVLKAIDKGLKPHIKHLKRDVTENDITRLTEIQIKRISKFDIDKAQQKIKALETHIEEVKNHLKNLIIFAINYFKNLKKKYGKGKGRQTKIQVFDDIEASKVIMKNEKLYVNRAEGFVGTGLKKDDYVCDCSDIDDVIVFTRKGEMVVTKVTDKVFIEKDIIHVSILKKRDRRTIYNVVYKDGRSGSSFIKRFYVDGVTRDKKYDITQGKPSSDILYFTANTNGEGEIITVFLREVGSIKKLKWDIDFSEILIKSRTSKGNVISKHAIKRIVFKQKGISTLKPRSLWFDSISKKINTEERGSLLGLFKGEDKIFVINKKGVIKVLTPEISLHFDDTFLLIEKLESNKPVSIIYYEGNRKQYFVKRFFIEPDIKEKSIISEHPKSHIVFISTDWRPVVEIISSEGKSKLKKVNKKVSLEDIIAIKGINILGNRLPTENVKQIKPLPALPYETKKLSTNLSAAKKESQSSLDF